MITAPTQAAGLEPVEKAASAEVTAVEAAGRGPLLLLIASGLAWLLLSGALSLLAAIQVRSPSFFPPCPILNYGHVQALQETAFIYGWIGNVGLAMILWILGRLGGEPLRAPLWLTAGALFWNIGLSIGVVGIAVGDATSFSMLELPRYAQPLMLASYGAIAVAGVLAWAGRPRDMMFAAHWYAVAALFLFPWLFSVAQMMLLWDPVRGTLQAVVAGWFAQGMWTLWMAPLGLAAAYYVVPRVTGRVLPAYDTASLGFWCLLFIGGWTGGRHLIGGPVPVWIATIAIVTSVILLVHYIIVFLNLRPAIGGGGTALRFIAFGLVAYVLGGLVDAVTAMYGVAVVTQFTAFDQAQTQLALYGGVSMMLFGGLYFALPRLMGTPWASRGLVQGHLSLSMLGIVLLVVSLAAAGLIQGNDLNNASVSFADIAAHTSAWLLVAAVAQALLLLGNLLLAVNVYKTAAFRQSLKSRWEALAQ